MKEYSPARLCFLQDCVSDFYAKKTYYFAQTANVPEVIRKYHETKNNRQKKHSAAEELAADLDSHHDLVVLHRGVGHCFSKRCP
ncbi:MAG: hypothetical protein D3904_13730 [Candidatus Electrothrix sp. EH2]|nr:hypothetical protein [Candidatus Electrothrix sp. EH2]